VLVCARCTKDIQGKRKLGVYILFFVFLNSHLANLINHRYGIVLIQDIIYHVICILYNKIEFRPKNNKLLLDTLAHDPSPTCLNQQKQTYQKSRYSKDVTIVRN
jgi:hypothetical protein